MASMGRPNPGPNIIFMSTCSCQLRAAYSPQMRDADHVNMKMKRQSTIITTGGEITAGNVVSAVLIRP